MLALVTLGSPGCYYAHLASGQVRVLMARQPIRDLREDTNTPDRLRDQLALVERARSFASELGLEVGRQYTSYVDWPGDRIVTTVVATNPGEVEAAGFRFPLLGEVPYKGFFDIRAAEDEAQALRAKGLDVCVVPVTAYSTLGWMDDPVTAPMLRQGDTRLVETLLHELVHATVFVPNQPEFNEGVARFIGQEATVRFDASAASRTRVSEDRRVAAETLAFRARVAALYEDSDESAGTGGERAAIEHAFRKHLAKLPLTSRDPVSLAARARLNDACLALSGTYAADNTRLERLLDELDGDLVRLIERLREAAQAEDSRAYFFGESGT
ncbi:MAG: aminopeptidase [Myxococcota bacterium]|nr:aminopeptidase [Myxococcota bacterium]